MELEVQKKFDDLSAKIVADVTKKMNDNLGEIKISLRKEITESMPNLKSEDVDTLILKNKDAFETKLTELQKAFTDRVDAIEIKSQKGGFETSNKSVAQQVAEVLKSNEANLKKIKEGGMTARGAGFEFEIKEVGDMSLAGNVSSSVTTRIPLEDRLEGFNEIPLRPVRFLDTLSRRSTTSNRITWVYESAPEGAAGSTAEGVLKNQIDFNIVIGKEDVEKYTAFTKATTEMLDDVPWMTSQITNNLNRKLIRAVEDDAYDGNGTSPNLNGVYTVATTFAAGNSAGTVDNANEVDVINCAVKQIELADQDMIRPRIFMHPDDVFKLKSYKVSSTDRRYVDMVYMAGNDLRISGIPVLSTKLVTSGEFLIGDMDKALLVQKGGIRVEIGLDGNDFTKNYRTILAEWRGAIVVETNDRTAFVKGVFATAKTALETT